MSVTTPGPGISSGKKLWKMEKLYLQHVTGSGTESRQQNMCWECKEVERKVGKSEKYNNKQGAVKKRHGRMGNCKILEIIKLKQEAE